MSIGTAIVIVGTLALIVFGPPWVRKAAGIVCVLAVFVGVGGGVYLYEQNRPVPQFDTTDTTHVVPQHPKPTCTPDQMSPGAAGEFNEIQVGLCLRPDVAAAVEACGETKNTDECYKAIGKLKDPPCGSDQIDKIKAAGYPKARYRMSDYVGMIFTTADVPDLGWTCVVMP